MLRSCFRFQVTCNDIKHTSLLWSILPFFFHSPVLFHQKWTEMIDTGYRDPWGATRDFPRPRIQNSKTGNCFPTCQCGFTDIVTGLILLSHLLHIYCGNCKGKSVFYVQYDCTEPCVVMLLVLRGQVTTHSAGPLLWFTTVICWGLLLHLSFSKQIPPSLNNSNHIPSYSAPVSSPCPRWVPALGALQPAFSGVCMPCVLHGAVWAAVLPSKSLCWDATGLHLCFLCISGSQS